jgi:hypothetical protein
VSRWATSAYFGGNELVYHGPPHPGKSCPCSRSTTSDDETECVECETFRCPRCEQWVTWEAGHGGGETCCPLCDECCVALDMPCAEPLDLDVATSDAATDDEGDTMTIEELSKAAADEALAKGVRR